ncbi:2-hydroxyacyl- lyase 1-like [Brachionus plicatilis]|uniref:2-hydroxyacyl-lyase 1-like n=1 Tax=Brachionus plicatilis TaxID=10195 RepID=A0A3M7R5V4_BRAPC|nr:2-hydroxyacyl- lyase 1-like [Brachionus plicatilis]
MFKVKLKPIMNFLKVLKTINKNLLNNTKRTASIKMSQDKLDGASLCAKSLKDQGVEYMFGVVGIPVIEIALRAQQYGIKYIGMRNEQSASYAASSIGYLTRKPAVALCVSGPGFVHTLAGMANANENAWPLLVVGGSSDLGQESQGAFQEYPQVTLGRSFAKYSARPSSLSQIPFYVEKAFRTATYGRPGSAYLDFAAEMITSTIEPSEVGCSAVCGEAPRPLTSIENLQNVFESLKIAKKPLIIIGKGAAYSQAEEEINKLVESLGMPFLPTPMGKGVVDDDHSLCVSAARSTALKEADLIVLLGARLNWMLHFGQSPRFAQNVKIVQVDLNAEELGNNTNDCIKIQADLKSFSKQMNEHLAGEKIQVAKDWWDLLRKKVEKNKNVIQSMANDLTLPLNYYAAYAQIKKVMPKDCIIVSEGANTMDTSRSIMNHAQPRHR